MRMSRRLYRKDFTAGLAKVEVMIREVRSRPKENYHERASKSFTVYSVDPFEVYKVVCAAIEATKEAR